MASKKATLYIAMKLPGGRWTVKSLPRKPTDLQPPSYFRLFWYSGDKKLSQNVGCSWLDARATQVHKETELERIAIGEKPEPESGSGGLELADTVSEYISRIKSSKKHKTFLAYNRALQNCLSVVGNKRLDALNRRDILRYMDWMRGKNADGRTIYNRLTHLKTFFNEFGLAWPMLRTDRVKYTEPLVRAYTEEELRRLTGHGNVVLHRQPHSNAHPGCASPVFTPARL